MNYNLVLSLLFGLGTFIFINLFFNVQFFSSIDNFFINIGETIVDYIGNYNTKRYIERLKKEKIVTPRENIFVKYNRLVESLIMDFNLPLTLEGFNSIM